MVDVPHTSSYCNNSTRNSIYKRLLSFFEVRWCNFFAMKKQTMKKLINDGSKSMGNTESAQEISRSVGQEYEVHTILLAIHPQCNLQLKTPRLPHNTITPIHIPSTLTPMHIGMSALCVQKMLLWGLMVIAGSNQGRVHSILYAQYSPWNCF